jgi:hypothetical protein
MADQGSQGGSFWTSLPGRLTGAAALITAISGLAIWHSKSNPPPAPAAAHFVQQRERPKAAPTSQPTGAPAVPIGSQEWCSEKYTAWQNEKTQTGVDDAGLHKEIVQAHCNQFGFNLGKVKAQP